MVRLTDRCLTVTAAGFTVKLSDKNIYRARPVSNTG